MLRTPWLGVTAVKNKKQEPRRLGWQCGLSDQEVLNGGRQTKGGEAGM